MDEEQLMWWAAMLVSLHNSSSYDEPDIQAAQAADVADCAIEEFNKRYIDDEVS